MLAQRSTVIALIVLFSFGLAGVALANDISSEAGNYAYTFETSVKGDMAQDISPDNDLLVDLGTEAGEWGAQIVDSRALEAARAHDYDRNRLSSVGTEAGNTGFSFERDQMRTCEGMLC